MIGLRQNHQPLCTHMTCPGASAGQELALEAGGDATRRNVEN